MAEGSEHLRSKLRMYEALQRFAVPVKMEHKKTIAVDYGKAKSVAVEYTYDLYFECADFAVAIEIDGKVGHSTSQARGQDRHRDHSSKKQTIATIRYPSSLLSQNWSDKEIMQDIEFQLNDMGFDGSAIFRMKN